VPICSPPRFGAGWAHVGRHEPRSLPGCTPKRAEVGVLQTHGLCGSLWGGSSHPRGCAHGPAPLGPLLPPRGSGAFTPRGCCRATQPAGATRRTRGARSRERCKTTQELIKTAKLHGPGQLSHPPPPPRRAARPRAAVAGPASFPELPNFTKFHRTQPNSWKKKRPNSWKSSNSWTRKDLNSLKG